MKYLVLLLLLLPFSLYADHTNPQPIAVKYIQSDKIKLYLSNLKLTAIFRNKAAKNNKYFNLRPWNVEAWITGNSWIIEPNRLGSLMAFGLILDIDYKDITMIAVEDKNLRDIAKPLRTSFDVSKFFSESLTGTLSSVIRIKITVPFTVRLKNGEKFIKLKVYVKTLKGAYYNIFKLKYSTKLGKVYEKELFKPNH